MLSMAYLFNWEMAHAIYKEHIVIRIDYSDSWSYHDFATIHLWKTTVADTYIGVYIYQDYIREIALCYSPALTPTTAPKIGITPLRLSSPQWVDDKKKKTGYLPVQENPIYNYYVKFLDLKTA